MSAPKIHRLANGVTLVCDPAPGYHTLALSLVAGRGARWEDEARCGWSHLLEHMVFKGAGERSAREIVEAVEADGGQINAATGHERTSFQVRALGGGLPLALDVTADLVLRPTLTEEDLAREKNVVAQEIAEAADTPDDQVFELAQAAAFTGQPLGRPILGAPHTLAPATPPALNAWRETLYAPDRLVVSVAGAVDEDLMLRHAEALFGSARAPDVFAPEAAVFTGGVAFERRRLEQAHLVFLLPGPAITDPDYWPFRLLAETLGGGMSSRLFQEVRERLGLAYAIDAYAEAWWDTGVLGVYAGCAPDDAGRLAEAVANEIKAMTASVSVIALARSKAQLKASLFMSGESLSARAEQAAAQILVFGDLVAPSAFAEAIDAVTPEAISNLVTRMIGGRRFAAAVLGPRTAANAAPRFEQRLYS
jgi:predicted Zn-dependent peptidase